MQPHSVRRYEGIFFAVDLLRWVSERGVAVEKEVVRHPGAVTVVPRLGDGRIVMIRNWRISVERWLLELCAGKLEPGEDPAAAALRELAEETGYAADEIRPLGGFYTSPGLSDEWMQVFEASGLHPGRTRLEQDERIEVVPRTLDEIDAALRGGELVDGKTIAALSLWRIGGSVR